MTQDELKALIEDLRLNHEYCPKEVILQAADELERLAQPEQEPVVGTKTWFEDGKVVTQHLTAKDIYKEPEQEPMAILNHAHGVHTFRNVKLKGLPDGEYLVYTHQPQRKPLSIEFGIQEYVDIGQYSLQVIFKDRPSADRFKAAHGIK